MHQKAIITKSKRRIKSGWESKALLWHGDVEAFLDSLPEDIKFDLIFTSPPYNIGKPYEQSVEITEYLDWQKRVIIKALTHLRPTGSICWQVGNYVQKGSKGKESAILPLDYLFFDIFKELGLKLRNRIVWHFGHGLHCNHRFSGRYEVVLWFTKSDEYFFDLDSVRVTPKYPSKKHFKGPNIGKYSCNPKGKNPEDVWELTEDELTPWEKDIWNIPNVNSNHIEKTKHPCQFPVALVDRFVLSMTPRDGLVFDPFAGVASAGVAALLHGRRFIGCEIDGEYIQICKNRLNDVLMGKAQYRPYDKPIYDPKKSKLSLEAERSECD